MAEMVASALVGEGVSGGLSLAASNREEKASQGHLMERLEMAQSGLKFALERSGKMTITDVSLLQRRMTLKGALDECTVVYNRLLVVGVPVSSSLLCRMFMHAVQLVSPNKDLLTRSEVERFECFAEKAHNLVRDVESGFSLLARFRFSNPSVTHLLEGKNLQYFSEQGKKKKSLFIEAVVTEDHGVMARLLSAYRDPKEPRNSFSLALDLRLSESTNIVGITTKCLQSLAPDFKPSAQAATRQLAHLYTQVQVSNCASSLSDNGFNCPDPVCCTTNGVNKSCTSSTISSELSGRFPEEVTYFSFSCNVSGADYNTQSSTRQVNGKTMKVWLYLELLAIFTPHSPSEDGQLSTLPLHFMEDTALREAINCFICQPEQTVYKVSWFSAHGTAFFWVSKPEVDMR